jgi:N-acetylmuramoyl-L-alanine amidase
VSSATTHKTLATLLAALIFLGATPSADEKRISIYSTVATYALPVVDRNGREYVGLLEILEPLGRVSTRVEGPRWKLRFNDIDSEFVAHKTRGRIRGRDADLAAPFLIENSRGLVPLSSLSTLLPRFLGTPVNFHEDARRLFIGDVATQIRAQLDATNPPRLVLNFSAPVNPTISTEPGKLRMVFTRDPLVPPGSQAFSFDNKTITQTTFSESNGSAELVIAGTAPLMASFSNNRQTITVAVAPQGAVAGTAPALPTFPTPPPPAPPNLPSGAAVPAPAVTGTSRRLIAVVDPAHGGEERGAALSDKLAEKDVTLGFGRLLRHELEMRGFAVLLLRDGDASLTLDQRAGAANAAHAGIYLSLHATSHGTGARAYTAQLPVEGEAKGIFHPWNAAQAPALPISRSAAAAIVSELQKKQFPARDSTAALRPLNNVQMAAVAVELAPGPGGMADLASAEYQQKAAAAIADAVASLRDRLGAQP